MAGLYDIGGRLRFTEELDELPVLTDGYELGCLLTGELELPAEGGRRTLRTGDLFVRNPGEEWHCFAAGSTGAVLLQIPEIEFAGSSPARVLRFAVAPHKQKQNETVSMVLRELARNALSEDPQLALKNKSLYYSILDLMITFFQAEQAAGEEDPLLREMLLFLHRNYARQISLEELAEACSISTSYVSKYLKQKTGKSFFEYLTGIRLRYAKRSLETGGEAISRISFDCGFSSLSLFNRSFRKEYGVTPSEYRRSLTPERSPNLEDAALRRQFAAMVEAADVRRAITLTADVRRGEPYRKNWNEGMNFGHAHELLNSEVQEQLKRLKRRLGFRWLHIAGLFTQNMNIDIRSEQGFNFSRINQMLDFLVENGITPFLDLGFQPWELFFGPSRNFYQRIDLTGYRPEQYESLADAFLQNCLARYGRTAMEDWLFDFSLPWEQEQGEMETYYRCFEALKRAAAEVSPRIRVGGCAIHTYELDRLDRVLAGWEEREARPDFLSVFLYPYHVTRMVPDPSASDHFARTGQHFGPEQNDNYLSDRLAKLETLLARRGYGPDQLYVVGWGFSVSCRNYLNDASYLAAYTVRTLIGCIGRAGMLARTGLSDLIYSSYLPTGELFGGVGLMSPGGIYKPVYYALEFLNRLGDTLLLRDEGSILTRVEGGEYRIVLCNKSYLTAEYYSDGWEEPDVRRMSSYLDGVRRDYVFRLEGVEPGEYQVRIQTIGDKSGAPLIEWGKLDYEEKLSRWELEYLAAICRPRLTNSLCASENGVLTVETSLDPDDVQYIEIVRKKAKTPKNKWF